MGEINCLFSFLIQSAKGYPVKLSGGYKAQVQCNKILNISEAYEPFQKCLLMLLFVSFKKIVRSADIGYIACSFYCQQLLSVYQYGHDLLRVVATCTSSGVIVFLVPETDHQTACYTA